MSKVKNIKSVFHRLSREFEQHIFKIIGEFAGSTFFWKHLTFIPYEFGEIVFLRLVFRTTKRRFLGSVIVEDYTPEKEWGTFKRKRLVTSMWSGVVDSGVLAVQKLITTLKVHTNVDTTEIEKVFNQLSYTRDYTLKY